MNKKPTGTLVLDALRPGKTLYLLSTGTGIAPFASVIREPETYEKFDKVVLTHTCREVAELAYGFELMEQIKTDEILSELVGEKLKHISTCTREDHPLRERITTMITEGSLFDQVGEPQGFDPDQDRVMICGSMEMLNDCKDLCLAAGMEEGANSKPADFVIEKAFVG